MAEKILSIPVVYTNKAPVYKTPGANGLELFSAEKEIVIIPHGQRRKITTGVSMAIPEGYCGKIEAKSGLAWNSGLIIMGGLIDSDYRGVIDVIVYNTDKDYEVKPGQAIAQLVIYPAPRVSLVFVGSLSSTVRGEGGFGSTGL